jgi:hypothetical protein
LSSITAAVSDGCWEQPSNPAAAAAVTIITPIHVYIAASALHTH